ncbi:MAG TPA: alpha/beta hydrolase [Burkholderiales bacterium]
MAALRESVVTLAGVRSPLIEAGPEGAPEAVVYVHGNPGSRLDFQDLVSRTGDFARAIAPDIPGFGDADKPHPRDFKYRVRAIGAHLAAMLNQLGVRRAHFVGHDFGGPFSIGAVLARPQAAGSLSFINTGILKGYRWHKWARIWRTPVIGELFMLFLNEKNFKKGFHRLPPDFVDQMWRHFDARTKRVVLDLYRGTNTEDMSPVAGALRKLDLPSIVVWGVHDLYVPVEFADTNREALPRATVHRIEKAGHWPFIDRPDEVAGILLPFLRSVMRG